jgi:hypothetical protein
VTSTRNKIRFGCFLPIPASPINKLLKIARVNEEAGFDSICAPAVLAQKLQQLTNIWRPRHTASGICIRPKTKPSRIEMLKEMIRALGLNPEEILTKEALAMRHRAVMSAGKEESRMETLLKALKQKLKEELAEIPVLTHKTV